MSRSCIFPLLALLVVGGPALAGEVAGSDELPALADQAPVAESDLTAARAGEGMITPYFLSLDEQGGTVSGNTADSTTSGGNSISDFAFQNASGFPTVIQNSGNNVLIQSSVIVNIALGK